jgi:hypothetical protein
MKVSTGRGGKAVCIYNVGIRRVTSITLFVRTRDYCLCVCVITLTEVGRIACFGITDQFFDVSD